MEWTRLKLLGIAPYPRIGWQAAPNKNNIYFYGGFNGEIFFSDLHVLNLDTMTWLYYYYFFFYLIVGQNYKIQNF